MPANDRQNQVREKRQPGQGDKSPARRRREQIEVLLAGVAIGVDDQPGDDCRRDGKLGKSDQMTLQRSMSPHENGFPTDCIFWSGFESENAQPWKTCAKAAPGSLDSF